MKRRIGHDAPEDSRRQKRQANVVSGDPMPEKLALKERLSKNGQAVAERGAIAHLGERFQTNGHRDCRMLLVRPKDEPLSDA